MIKSRNFKRSISLTAILLGLALFVVATETEDWWERATPVSRPHLINESNVYIWKGLNRACVHLPPDGMKCKSIKDWNMKDGKILVYYYKCLHINRAIR